MQPVEHAALGRVRSQVADSRSLRRVTAELLDSRLVVLLGAQPPLPVPRPPSSKRRASTGGTASLVPAASSTAIRSGLPVQTARASISHARSHPLPRSRPRRPQEHRFLRSIDHDTAPSPRDHPHRHRRTAQLIGTSNGTRTMRRSVRKMHPMSQPPWWGVSPEQMLVCLRPEGDRMSGARA
jgi:hypothetical protein